MTSQKHRWLSAGIGVALVWAVVPVALGVVWAFLHVVLGGFGGLQQGFSLLTNEMGYSGGSIFWGWMTVMFLASAGIVGFVVDSGTAQRGVTIALVVAGVAAGANTVHLGWQNSKNVARFYARAAVVYTPSMSNAPGSLQYLLAGAHKGANGCWVAKSDVASCIKIGTLAQAGFYPRVSSATGALTVMQRTSGSRQNVNLLPSSLTYLNGNGKDGTWSAIRDGFGAFQPTEGVVEWAGTNLPTECKFGGHDQFNKALNGVKSNSLVNYLTRLHQNFYWSNSDVWGYCNAAHQPVIVIPLEQQVHYLSQTVSEPAGVYVLTGSRSGLPHVDYRAHATNLPGPVYPKSIADTQLTSVNWMAGRAHLDRSQFGFEPTNSGAQAGNTQDYLLKSETDGHTYWVTPLTLASSQSQLFVAYAMVRADSVTSGQLNTFKVYTLAANDPRSTNVDQLEAMAKSFMVSNAGGFIPSGGQLIEFTPAQGDFWRAFGEINGRVIYRLDISANANETPILVSLDSNNNPTTVAGGGGVSAGHGAGLAYCGRNPQSLTNTQRLACLRLFAQAVN